MNNFEFYSPTCFVFGKDTETKSGEYVKRFGGTIEGFITLNEDDCTEIYKMMCTD